MTSVEPSVSTAVSRLTSARRRAIRRTPTASARVIVGSSPSGTLATRRPIAKVTASSSGSPATVAPISRKTPPARTAISAISFATLLTWTWSGLSSARTRWVRAAIRPSSVCMPVAKTTASASPAVHSVPEKTRSSASSSEAVRSPAAALRETGCDSPVSGEASISTEPEISRASPERRSPSSSSRTSPGTSAAAVISVATPSRRTRARGGR